MREIRERLAWLRRPGKAQMRVVQRAVAEVRRGEFAADSVPDVERIEKRRAELEQSGKTIVLFRSEYSGDPADAETSETLNVREACWASVSPSWGALLYALTREVRPAWALELGTNLGISTAYIAAGLSANGAGMLVSGDASRERLSLAVETLQKTGVADRVHLVHGRFQQTLPAMLDQLGAVDFVLIDGHHGEEATIEYFESIAERLTPAAIVVLDDIRWSDGMTRAWRAISERSDVGVAIDLQTMGIIVQGHGRRKLTLEL